MRRKTSISAPAKMNATRANLLDALLSQIGFADLAAHLSLSEAELIDAWDWEGSHPVISMTLRRCVFEAGSDGACRHLAAEHPDALLQLAHFSADEMQRLSSSLREDAIAAPLQAGSNGSQTFWTVPTVFCTWRVEDLSEAQSKALWDKAKRHSDLALQTSDTPRDPSTLGLELFHLAMCLHPPDAQRALDHFTSEAGLHPADPMLAPFHFNIAIPPAAPVADIERP